MDNVPVNVDAVMFWMVWDPRKAALEVADTFAAAARKYEESPRAFDLRAINLLYESVKDTGGDRCRPFRF